MEVPPGPQQRLSVKLREKKTKPVGAICNFCDLAGEVRWTGDEYDWEAGFVCRACFERMGRIGVADPRFWDDLPTKPDRPAAWQAETVIVTEEFCMFCKGRGRTANACPQCDLIRSYGGTEYHRGEHEERERLRREVWFIPLECDCGDSIQRYTDHAGDCPVGMRNRIFGGER